MNSVDPMAPSTVRPSATPSRELVISTAGGMALAPVLDIGLNALGVPVPPGTSAAIGALVTGVLHWLQKRGRANQLVTTKPAALG